MKDGREFTSRLCGNERNRVKVNDAALVNKIPLAFAPAITCVFAFGVFWSRGTQQASLAAMATGFVLGGIDLPLDIPLIGDTRVITDV